jgi:hypothetical protein
MLEAHLVEASDGVVALKQAKQAEQVEIGTCGGHPFASVWEWALNSIWRADDAHYSMDTTDGQCKSEMRGPSGFKGLESERRSTSRKSASCGQVSRLRISHGGSHRKGDSNSRLADTGAGAGPT